MLEQNSGLYGSRQQHQLSSLYGSLPVCAVVPALRLEVGYRAVAGEGAGVSVDGGGGE